MVAGRPPQEGVLGTGRGKIAGTIPNEGIVVTGGVGDASLIPQEGVIVTGGVGPASIIPKEGVRISRRSVDAGRPTNEGIVKSIGSYRKPSLLAIEGLRGALRPSEDWQISSAGTGVSKDSAIWGAASNDAVRMIYDDKVQPLFLKTLGV